MGNQPTFGSNAACAKLFLDVMRSLCHGRIEDLEVHGGVPRVTPRTRLFRRVRLDRPDPPGPPRPVHSNHRPHPQHEKLLAHCRYVRDGLIARLEIADGLPVHWETP